MYQLPGQSPDQPFRIMALLNSRAVGDTIFYHIYAASVKNLFDHATLTLYQRDDRDYKNDLLYFNHKKDYFFVAPENFNPIPIDSFQPHQDIINNNEEIPDYIFQHRRWINSKSHVPDLILSPASMDYITLTGFDHPGFLSIPDRSVDPLRQKLIDHGVSPDRWFCVLNYREPGYKHRPSRFLRDVSPIPYMALVEYIVDRLGGQVVRVGHPNMTPFPQRPGFIDLASLEDAFDLHAFAISRARFLVGSLSGISHLGSALNTPTLMTNCLTTPYCPGCWRDHDLALYLSLYTKDGRRYTMEERDELGLHDIYAVSELVQLEEGWACQNTPAELGKATRRMMESTSDCQGWRIPHLPEAPPGRPNKLSFPVTPRLRVPIIEYPDLAMKPPIP